MVAEDLDSTTSFQSASVQAQNRLKQVLRGGVIQNWGLFPGVVSAGPA